MSGTVYQKRLSACGLVLALFLLFGDQVARANLIINGDFEIFTPFATPNLGTIVSGGWVFKNQSGVVGTDGNPGQYARLESLGSPSNDPSIEQAVTGLTIGHTYTVSWDLALRVNFEGAGTGRSFGVFLDNFAFGNALLFDEYLNDEVYKSDSVNFIATSTSHTLIFAGELDSRTNGGVGDTDVSYRIDNIALTSAVPEPSTIALLLTGGVGLVGYGWRRKKKLAA
ncbi:MAG: PEP-CTERM sorting domain-containing protein [Planctomycetota bacterium]|nr:PEP-CTERM sorting domain-containing protein [Planctomycetota bacterium]MDA1214145.1 PEP-CTERM sorting domain-containing protein [Planctomycetota bacterium]